MPFMYVGRCWPEVTLRPKTMANPAAQREGQMADVSILRVSHENFVQFVMEIPKAQSLKWQQSLNDQGQGKLIWAVAETGSATQG